MIIKGVGLLIEQYKNNNHLKNVQMFELLGLKKGTYHNIVNTDKVSNPLVLVQLIKLLGSDFEQMIGLDNSTEELSKSIVKYEITDMKIFNDLLEEQKRTNELLKKIYEKE